MSSGSGKRKLLFVLSNDYGELSTAVDFLAGQPFEALILAPDRLFQANGSDLPARCAIYHSVPDILTAARSQSPDVVLLFSAYLYAVNGLLDLDAVRELVDGLRSLTRALVTSDPFLGELFRLDNSTFSDKHPAKRQLTDHFAQVVRMLDPVTHLYRVEPRAGAAGGAISFYNPRVVLGEPEHSAMSATAISTPGVLPGLKRWMFVLSAEDYATGIGRWGKARFDGVLLEKLKETANAGRQPVLIGPGPCIDALRQATSTPASALLLEFCKYTTFLSLLSEAEYCFYWNLFSHSIIARVMNRQPVFFFDSGHLVHAMPSFLEIGLKHFYACARPRSLDQDARLSAEQLAGLALEEDGRLEPARQRFAQSPEPAQVVERLLGTPNGQSGADP